MATKLKMTNKEKLNAGMKSIIGELQVTCDKIKKLKGSDDLYNQMQSIFHSLTTEVENINYAAKILSLEESTKKEQSFYSDKTGISFNALPENQQLEAAANILLETGIDDYNLSSPFLKYISMLEKCTEQKEFVDDVEDLINKLKTMIDIQNDLKYELSCISNTPVSCTLKSIETEPIETILPVDNCNEIVELIKKIVDIEKKQADICEEASQLKSEQKKMYQGLPPNIDQATLAVKIAEDTMKSVSKQLVEKLGKK